MRVLVAVDGSSMAAEVLARAAPWLHDARADVVLMTVLDASELHGTISRAPGYPTIQGTEVLGVSGPVPAPAPVPGVWEYESQAVDRACEERRATLEALARTHLRGLEPRFRVEVAEHAAEEILRVAGEEEAEAIVIGTHGRTGLRRALMGSVAEGVVRHARVPVLVIPVPGT